MKITFTHKGRFGLCPVYISYPYSEAPVIEPRTWFYQPLLWLTDEWTAFKNWRRARRGEEPSWELLIGEELAPHVLIEIPDGHGDE